MSKRRKEWDCHEHKDEMMVSEHATVYHPERGQLCIAERHWNVILYIPIIFTDKSVAWQWVREGTIADLQESLCNLHVGFSTKGMEVRQ